MDLIWFYARNCVEKKSSSNYFTFTILVIFCDNNSQNYSNLVNDHNECGNNFRAMLQDCSRTAEAYYGAEKVIKELKEWVNRLADKKNASRDEWIK